MNYELFLSQYMRFIIDGERDALFETIRVWTGGLSTARAAALINLAAFCMDDSERYVEVGTFTGFTLIAAGYDTKREVLGIDNFDVEGPASTVGYGLQKQAVKERLTSNIKNFGHIRHTIIESDFRSVDLSGKKTGASYIDGKHDYQSVIDNLVWLEPSLVKDAVIIFDDVDCAGVSDAVMDWVHDHKAKYDLLFMARSKEMMYRTVGYDKTFTNGLAIVHYKGTG